MKFSRRKFLKASTGVALGTLGAHAIAAEKPVLTISADPRSPLYAIRELAERELDITLNITSGQYASRVQNAVFQSAPCQLFEFRSNNTASLWRSGAIKPIDASRLSGWDEIDETLTQIEAFANQGAIRTHGAMPNAEVYLQANGSLGATRSDTITQLPLFAGNESFAYLADEASTAVQDESWSWILSDTYRKKIALSNSPATVYYALAMAAKNTVGAPDIGDPNSPSPGELELLYHFVSEKASKHQFADFWSDPSQLIAPFTAREIWLANIEAQDIPALRSNGINLKQARPQEGFLAQSKVLFLASSVTLEEESTAYRFLDWLTSGKAGVEFSCCGYSSYTPQSARSHMDEHLWDYFYAGEPAAEAIYDPAGNLIAEAGERRPGGSFEERFQHIGLWAGKPIRNSELILHHWQHLVMQD